MLLISGKFVHVHKYIYIYIYINYIMLVFNGSYFVFCKSFEWNLLVLY